MTLWEQFTESSGLFIIGVLAIAYLTFFLISKVFSRFIVKVAKRINADPTNFSFLRNSIGFIIFLIALLTIFFTVPALKEFGNALFAGAGIIAAIVGFASQKAFSNIVSGIFILMFKPFRVGDHIELSTGKAGIVEEITLRHTIIKNYENQRIVIPNSIISEDTILNSDINESRICKFFLISVSYDSDLELAKQIIREVAESNPLVIDARTHSEKQEGAPIVAVRVVSLNQYSVDLRAYVWVEDYEDAFEVRGDLYQGVHDKFAQHGIEIPYPYQNIVLKNQPNT